MTATAALLAVACRAESREYRIAVLAPGGAEWAWAAGEPSIYGARMAAEELNADSGVRIGGRRYRIVLVEKLYRADGASAAAAAREALSVDRVNAIVGPGISDHAITVAPLAEQAGIPMLSPMSSSPELTANRRFVSRLAFLDKQQGSMLAHFSLRTLGASKAAIVYAAHVASSRHVADLFLRTFVAGGGDIQEAIPYSAADTVNFRPLLQRALATRPDVLLLPNYIADDSVQVRIARELGFRGQFLGSDTWDPGSVRGVPEAIGTIIAHQWNFTLADSVSHAFAQRYLQQHQREPRTTAAATYDAVRLLVHSAQRARSTDGALVTDSLRTTFRYVGAAATYRFTGTGDPQRGGVLLRIGRQRDSVLAVVDLR